jgi:hypothetical protein
MFRAVAAWSPTLLFDEADTYFGKQAEKAHEELRGLVNAGHRKGAVALRMVGEGSNMQPRRFSAYAAVAIAGLGDLPETILHRSITIRMRRRAPDEHVEPFRIRTGEIAGKALGRRAGAWAKRNVGALTGFYPDMPPGVVDRPADVWEPLLAIAEIAGGGWPERARSACVTFTSTAVDDEPSWGMRLLEDCRSAFDLAQADQLPTEELLTSLYSFEESPWAEIHGRPLSSQGLAKRLRPYGIHPAKYRDAQETHRGYSKADFEDAWHRYLTAPRESGTSGTSGTVQASTTRDVPGVPDVPLLPVADRNGGGTDREAVRLAVAEEIERVTL